MPVILGRDGVLYGTSAYGGRNGAGVVFKLNPDGHDFRVLHNFTNVLTTPAGFGSRSCAALVEGWDGMLFGTTGDGGSNGMGTVFRLNKDGSGFKVLHNFAGSEFGDGASPCAELIEGHDRVLYGTTQRGGGKDGGTVFKLNQDGSGFLVLHSFGSSPDDSGW
jgi:uncharacterized repeat protein (TIGR03803 family)